MAQEIDLDDVSVSPAAYDAWLELSSRVARTIDQLQEVGRTIRPEDIPDERGRIEDDGSLTIFVEIPGVLEVSMSVPPDQWARKQ